MNPDHSKSHYVAFSEFPSYFPELTFTSSPLESELCLDSSTSRRRILLRTICISKRFWMLDFRREMEFVIHLSHCESYSFDMYIIRVHNDRLRLYSNAIKFQFMAGIINAYSGLASSRSRGVMKLYKECFMLDYQILRSKKVIIHPLNCWNW